MSVMPFIWTHLSFTLVATMVAVFCIDAFRWIRRRQEGTSPLAGGSAFRGRGGPSPALKGRLSQRESVRFVQRPIFDVTTISALLISAALSVVPVGDVDLAGHMLAFSGELSFALIFFLAIILGGKIFTDGRADLRPWHTAQWAWTIGGLAIYGVALSGRGPDLYSLGYGSSLAWILLAVSAAAAITGRWLMASLSLGIVLAWQLRFSGAANLCDYAIDPFLFVGAAVQTSARLCGTCRRVGTKLLYGRKLNDRTSVVVAKAA